MKYIQVIAACDMTKAQTGRIEPAAGTVYLAFGSDPDDLKVRELDLTEDWSRELHEFLLPFLDASHEPGEMGAPPGGSNGLADKRQYKKNMVAWAQENGYRVTALARGGWYPPVKTKQAYAHHRAGRDDLLTEANGLAPDYDPATGNPA